MDPVLIFFFLALIFSIIIHEVSHGFAAEMLGDPTARLQGRLTLNPIPHIDIVGSILVPAILVLTKMGFLFGWAKPVPYNPYNLRNQRWGEAIVAGAGPGVNILLALLFGTMIRFGEGFFSPMFLQLAGVVVFINIMLAFFNLIPLPPLDGSKILKSVLPYHASMSFQKFENFLLSGGLLMTLFIFWIFISLFGGFFFAGLSILFYFFTGTSLSALI